MAEAKELLNKLKDIKNSEGTTYKRTKGAMNGALIGAGGGLLIGLNKNYSLIPSGIVGAIIGGLIAYILLPKEEREDEE